MLRPLAPIAAALLAFAAGAAAAQPARPAETGNIANGKRLFMADGCYQCHGTTGAGGGNAGPRLIPNPFSLQALTNQLRRPNRMPPYGPLVISDAEIADIHAYLVSIPPSPKVEDIPLLNR